MVSKVWVAGMVEEFKALDLTWVGTFATHVSRGFDSHDVGFIQRGKGRLLRSQTGVRRGPMSKGDPKAWFPVVVKKACGTEQKNSLSEGECVRTQYRDVGSSPGQSIGQCWDMAQALRKTNRDNGHSTYWDGTQERVGRQEGSLSGMAQTALFQPK